MKTYSCIITAGGAGRRFGGRQKKQFFEIGERPLINVTIDIFYPVDEINEIIVTLPADEYEVVASLLYSSFPNKVKCIVGGTTRQESVYNALQSCDNSNKYVIIHDAVRPFLAQKDLQAMMEIIGSFSINDSVCNAVIAGSKVKHTTKKVAGDFVIETIPRADLIEVYTPQIFCLHLIKRYHKIASDTEEVFTDDASIFEFFKEPVSWYETDSCRLKVTTKEDLDFANYKMQITN